MSIEWFRDLVLCIFGLGATVVLIFLAVLAFLLYRRLQPALDSMKTTARNRGKSFLLLWRRKWLGLWRR